MLLAKKIAVIHAAAGAVGSTLARAFAKEGAIVHLTGRKRGPLDAIAKAIIAAGGVAEVAEVDALDEAAIERHLETVGRVDIAFNGIGIPQVGIQGIPLAELSVEKFTAPVTSYARSHFLTARAAARRMVAARSGVILMHTPEPARTGAPLTGGMSLAWAAIEALTRMFSFELAAQGVRAVCLRSTGMPETPTIDVVFGLHAKAHGITREQFRSMMEGMSHHHRSTTLAELAGAAVFAASDLASGMTGTVLNLTAGKSPD